ncbi:MAG: AAA family ATPase [Dechloromonas sp.]|nr:MAG: AAA family ATPase [Dechloromonas sp.]
MSIEHLSEQAVAYLDRPVEDKLYFIRSPRWIGYQAALKAHAELEDLLTRPPSFRMAGMMIVGPYANGKTMLIERFAVQHLRAAEKSGDSQKVWIVQTREGAGLSHLYGGIIAAFRAPSAPLGMMPAGSLARRTEQVHRLLVQLKPKLLIFDEFHNALRGRTADIQSVLAYLRRLGREYDISSVLVGELAVYDYINSTTEMASRVQLCAVPRWQYNSEYLQLLNSLEASLPLPDPSDLSEDRMARRLFSLSDGLIGETVSILSAAAVQAVRAGKRRISTAVLDELSYVPLVARREAAVRDMLQ